MSEPRTAAGRAWLGHSCDDGEADQLDHILAIEAEATMIDREVLARAMWEALSDRNVVRIDADSGKELFDIADAILAALPAAMDSTMDSNLTSGELEYPSFRRFEHENGRGGRI